MVKYNTTCPEINLLFFFHFYTLKCKPISVQDTLISWFFACPRAEGSGRILEKSENRRFSIFRDIQQPRLHKISTQCLNKMRDISAISHIPSVIKDNFVISVSEIITFDRRNPVILRM